tara:strand:- start:6546 stop:6833 length:288 start_codon:yes stop_codon:yes gene_type:complete
MAGLITMSLDVTKLPKEKFIKGKKGVYYNFTIAINDETKYGNNVSMYDAQTQEERQAKAQRNYLGNGKVVWNNGTIVNAEKETQVAEVSADGDIF